MISRRQPRRGAGPRTEAASGRGNLAALATILAILAVAVAVFAASGRDRAPVAAVAVPGHAASASASTPGARGAGPYGVQTGGVDAFRVRFRRPPRAGLVFDLRTGVVLWRRNPARPLPIASLTKMMTALVVVERGRPRERFRVARATFRYTGSGMGVIPKRRKVRLEPLLYGLLIASGNDAAIALASHVAGSQARFVALMNVRARSLGLRCTRFTDVHGLSGGDRSCALDLAALARVDMAQPRIARIVGARHARLRFPAKRGRIDLYSHNPLLRAGYPGTIGLKTGYTDPAGRCLVAVVRRKGRTLGVVLLRSPDPLAQARKLLARAYGDPLPRPRARRRIVKRG